MERDLGKASGFFASAGSKSLEVGLPSRTTPRPVSLLSFARAEAFSCVLFGRLYYKAVLPPAPTLRILEGADSDAAIALRLYAGAGVAGLAPLEGDFCVLVFDHTRRRFVARRDPLGAYPLYYTWRGGSVAFATEFNELAAASDDCSTDYLADFIMGTRRRDRDAYDACPSPSVKRVGTDAILCIEVATGRCTQVPCWDWREKSVDPQTDDVEEMARQYAPVLRAAVEERVVGRTAAQLSGGMDSTATCLLAHRYVRDTRGGAPLRFLSLVYEKLPTLALERPFIDCVANDPNIGLTGDRIDGDDILYFDILLDPPPHDEPYSGLWAMGQNRAIISRAADLDIDSVLTGEGADDLLDPSPKHVSDLVARGRLRAAWRAACQWAETQGSNPWSVIRQHGLERIAPRPRAILDRVFGFEHSFFAGDSDRWSVPSWIDRDFARRLGLAERGVAERTRTNRLSATSVSSNALKGLELRSDQADGTILFAPHGIQCTHPFLDPRVIGLALGINEQSHTPSRRRKPVLAEAMRGVLPEMIRTRPDKRGFNEVLYLGYRRNLHALERMVAASSDLGLFDTEVLIARLHEAAMGLAAPSDLRRLNETLSLIAWFAHRARWRNRPSTYHFRVHIALNDTLVHNGGDVSSKNER